MLSDLRESLDKYDYLRKKMLILCGVYRKMKSSEEMVEDIRTKTFSVLIAVLANKTPYILRQFLLSYKPIIKTVFIILT